MQTFVKTRVTQGGRIVIPADMRKQLGIEIGEDVRVSVDDGSLVIRSQKEGIRKAQEMFRRLVPTGTSIVDELIADRRKEAANE
ncbi:MAG TPA: AbrB/MazE/SpoVT family DNA-binding domain-containing protein [Pyrinomonadaceae bacterium]|nr:AbrB/MazE/SpoVT family DNA-binding domain-containing protein [Pyrinomonadaceae bacterium]